MTVRLITVGISDYPDQANWSSPEIAVSGSTVAALLSRHGVTHEPWSQTSRPELQSALEEWAGRPNGEETSHILYWTGHGKDAGGKFWLATAGSKDPLHKFQALSHEAFADYLRNELQERAAEGSPAWTVVIIDTCGSGPGVRRIRDSLGQEHPASNLALIGTMEASGEAYVGTFPTVLAGVLDTMDAESGPSIVIRELVRRVGDHLGPDQAWGEAMSPRAWLPKTGTAPPDITSPVDIHNEIRHLIERYPEAALTHFFPKAQGAEINDLAWHFRGREAERRRVNHWLETAGQGLLVVTGIAGSGKSALLGMVLASTDPDLMATIAQRYDIGGPSLCPREVRFDGILHLNGHDINEAVRSLAADLELDPGPSIDDFIRNVRDREDQRRITVLADALDESRDPFTIGTGLLGRLARTSGVRVLLGTRRSLGEDPDNPRPTHRDLIHPLNLLPDQILDLPADPSAISQYVEDRLTAALTPDQPTVRRIREIATHVGYDSGQPFLYARLAVHEILADPRWLDPHQDFAAEFPQRHAGIFARAVARLHRDEPKVESLLRSLAYAHGNGFPRNDGIWAIAGSALHGGELTDADIDTTLTTAAPYIMRDREHDQTVYRLAHRTFVEHYRNQDPAGSG